MDPCTPCPYSPQVVRQRMRGPNLDVTYPLVINIPPEVYGCINRQIRERVSLMISNQGYPDPTITFSGQYKTRLNERCLLSLTEEIYSYREHAAHGTTLVKSWNFDVYTGMNLELSDLFIPFSGYSEEINRNIREQIQSRNIPLLSEFTGVGQNPDYYLTPDSLVIFFQLYELAPYVYGILEFPIPLASMRQYVSGSSPLARLYCP